MLGLGPFVTPGPEEEDEEEDMVLRWFDGRDSVRRIISATFGASEHGINHKRHAKPKRQRAQTYVLIIRSLLMVPTRGSHSSLHRPTIEPCAGEVRLSDARRLTLRRIWMWVCVGSCKRGRGCGTNRWIRRGPW